MSEDKFEDFDNFLEALSNSAGEVLSGALHLQRRDPKSNNPKDYPRSTDLSLDEDARFMQIKLDSMHRTFQMSMKEVQTQWMEMQAQRNRLHLHLQKKYPETTTGDNGGGFGIRRFEGGLWCVGWDGGHKDPQ